VRRFVRLRSALCWGRALAIRRVLWSPACGCVFERELRFVVRRFVRLRSAVCVRLPVCVRERLREAIAGGRFFYVQRGGSQSVGD
jgi:hypothetical protein